MRNIPIFSTEFGVASLILDQIPYKQTAYVHIQDASAPDAFMQECAQFCRAAGADLVLATGSKFLQSYPEQYRELSMCVAGDALPQVDAELRLTTAKTMERWVQIYNQKMQAVDGAAYIDRQETGRRLAEGNTYFVLDGQVLLGIGIASGEEILALASVTPGAGERVVAALAKVLKGNAVRLNVASTNRRAISLYKRMGFETLAVKRIWSRIL